MGLFPNERDLNRPPETVELMLTASSLGVRSEEVLVRLDAFLQRHLKWRSRTSIQKLIRDGWVHVDAPTPEQPGGTGVLSREQRPGRRLRDGTRVVIEIPPEARLPVPEDVSSELVVLWEDEDALAVDKPPLLPVHPSGRHHSDTLIQRVHARFRDSHLEHGVAPRLCHRLDRETSGIVLVAKNPDAHRRLATQFEERRTEKEYLAVVWGSPEEEQGEVALPIGPSRTSEVRLKMAVAADGLPCRTTWRVLERLDGRALLACQIHTGRQHQIRVHLAALGMPIVGDKLYGPDEQYFCRQAEGILDEEDLADLELPRHALHNHRLVFTSSMTGERVEVTSPLAQDLEDYLTAWR